MIPQPEEMRPRPGRFSLTEDTGLVLDLDAEHADLAGYLRQVLGPATGFAFPVTTREPGPCIALEFSPCEDPVEGAYELVVGEGEGEVNIRAGSRAGLINAIHTVLQLLPGEIESDRTIRRGQAPPGLGRGSLVASPPAGRLGCGGSPGGRIRHAGLPEQFLLPEFPGRAHWSASIVADGR